MDVIENLELSKNEALIKYTILIAILTQKMSKSATK